MWCSECYNKAPYIFKVHCKTKNSYKNYCGSCFIMEMTGKVNTYKCSVCYNEHHKTYRENFKFNKNSTKIMSNFFIYN